MKMSKTILPALAMLIVSAVMLSTASFAWFAMNNSVSANGMEVTVKSDSVYILIQSAPDATTAAPQIADIRAAGSTSDAGVAIGSTEVFPSAYYTSSLKGDSNQYVADASGLNTPNNWYYATGASVGNSAAATDESANGKNDQALTNFDQYVVRYRYWVCLAEGSTAITSLYINNLSITTDATGEDISIDPVKVVVACGNNYFEYNAQTNTSTTDFLSGNEGGLAGDEIIELWLYVYYDGNHADVYTNNLANLAGANIQFSLAKDLPETN